jgi:hypothetical protein
MCKYGYIYIKINLNEVRHGWCRIGFIGGSCEHVNERLEWMKCMTSYIAANLPRRTLIHREIPMNTFIV